MRNIFIIFMSFFSLHCLAQADNKSVQQGNENYNKKNFTEAEKQYQQALQKNPKNEPAIFNLGNALFGQEKFEDAMQHFQKVGETTTDPATRSEAYHNLGNSYLMKQDYGNSIDAYKKALKANPNDMDTKYNLAYAQKKLQQQQQQDQNQQQQDQQNKDEQQQKQEDEKQDENQQGQNQQNDPQKNEQQNNQKPQPKKYSPEELERIMQALNNEDKKTQDKLNMQRMETQRVQIEKDW
ncbi:MAG: tetratricopeptide repeat protein [Chitinophagales bacterium]